jgi:hypothetical protein
MNLRGKLAEYKCKNCPKVFIARVADRNRGWARFCSKSCKAIQQTKLLGYPSYRYEDFDPSWDAHKTV